MADLDRNAGSTIPTENAMDRWEMGLRAASVGLVGVLVAAALLGLFGVRTTVATGSGNGITVSVTHAAVTRAGLATPFDVEVTSDDGSPLPPSITLRISARYLAMFDENGLEPEPSSSFNDADWTWWTFDIPVGASAFAFRFDARLEPAVQFGREATAAVEINGREMAAAQFVTWVMP